MKERPILMAGEMVRATLAGRKTQTRRVIKPQPELAPDGKWDWKPRGKWAGAIGKNGQHNLRCPYGQPGDVLWVRECFSPYLYRDGCWYWADGNVAAYDATKPKPSIYMPRWASRILLEVVDVRVERVQEISEEDAMAEGVEWKEYAGLANKTAKKLFRTLWDKINGKKHPWKSNPWVWRVEFKMVPDCTRN